MVEDALQVLLLSSGFFLGSFLGSQLPVEQPVHERGLNQLQRDEEDAGDHPKVEELAWVMAKVGYVTRTSQLTLMYSVSGRNSRTCENCCVCVSSDVIPIAIRSLSESMPIQKLVNDMITTNTLGT